MTRRHLRSVDLEHSNVVALRKDRRTELLRINHHIAKARADIRDGMKAAQLANEAEIQFGLTRLAADLDSLTGDLLALMPPRDVA